jgi:hypothetical protein
VSSGTSELLPMLVMITISLNIVIGRRT